MELEQLKQEWAAIDERIANVEIVSRRIVKEMIESKAKSSYENIYKRHIYSLVNIVLGGIAFAIINMQAETGLKLTAFTMVEGYIFAGFIYGLYMLRILAKIDVKQGNVDDLLELVLKYRRLYYFNFRTGIPSVIVLIALVYTLQNAFTFATILSAIVCIAIGGVVGYIQHRRYIQKFKEIEAGLDELREFRS